MASTRAAVSHPQELVSLKEAFAGKCRIIDDVGEFKHVVTIKRNNSSDLAYKFQITGDYPSEVPHIAIKSSQLTDHDKAELSQYLKTKAMATPNQPVLATLVKLADAWLKDQNMEYLSMEKEVSQKKSPKKEKKKPKKKDKHEEVIEEKKCSMKMAEDVIKRIQWDSALPTEEFIVGYLDRFVGIVEKVFSGFSWEDLASVDYDEMAIPQHRIQYFKYKNEIVWDKNKRLDNFFGSTGSNRTIMDVITEYKEPVQVHAGMVDGMEAMTTTEPTKYLTSTKITDTKVLFFGRSSVFSNFHDAVFSKDNQTYSCSEQYIQSKKAEVSNDDETARKILLERDPVQMKRLGKQIRGHDGRKWKAVRDKIVYDANVCKYAQNPDLLQQLQATGKRDMVECSPDDSYWGCGLAINNPAVNDEKNWTAPNQFGNILKAVRDASMSSDPKPSSTLQ